MLIDKAKLAKLRGIYSRGKRVILVKMDDPYTHIPPGTKGTVTKVDDIGTIHVNWDTGSSLGVVYGVDLVRLVAD